MVNWLHRRGQQLLHAKVKNADWQDWYILIWVFKETVFMMMLNYKYDNPNTIRKDNRLHVYAVSTCLEFLYELELLEHFMNLKIKMQSCYLFKNHGAV